MTQQEATAAIAEIRHTIVVAADVERAFDVFAAGIDRWWPRSHHIGDGELDTVVLEPRAGGRWYERLVDGAECSWGRVLEWDRPRRVALSWSISPQWELEADAAAASRIEVRFTAADNGSTLVELVHRDFDRHSTGAQDMRDVMDEGWVSTLQAYAEVARR
ncbi:MAG: SRPBCC family protein [Actinomycetota bacterium]|nr:SRPBCC family protein [Actinomycetota bacterium]